MTDAVNGYPVQYPRQPRRLRLGACQDDNSIALFGKFYRQFAPEITGTARMWLPLATTDPFQKVEVKSINAPGKQSILPEREHANRVLFLELGPEDSRKKVEIRYQVKRLEKAAYAAPAPGHWGNAGRNSNQFWATGW